MPPSRRIARINQLLREEIADLLRRDVKDETISNAFISITEVDTSPDLKNSRVFFSLLGPDEEIETVKSHLDRAAHFLRGQLMRRIELRYIPHLEFQYDPSLVSGARIMGLMRGIEHERADREPETEESTLEESVDK